MQNFRKNKLYLLLLVFVFAACSYSEVEVSEVRDIRITTLDKKGVDITGSVKIHNPNNYKIKISDTDADLYLDGRKAGKAKLTNNVTVPANFNDFLDVKVRTDFDEGSLSLLPIVLGATVKGKVMVGLKGELKAKSFLLGKKFDFDYEHEAKF